MEGNTLGLYQSGVTLFNQTFTATGTYNSPSFSAANFGGGAALVASWGTATVSAPTATFALQISTDGGVTWAAVPATAGSLTDVGTFTATAPTNSASVQVKTSVGTVYVGNLLRVQLVLAGTSVTSLPAKITLDAAKRFPDNA
jgi:hypothetical protein